MIWIGFIIGTVSGAAAFAIGGPKAWVVHIVGVGLGYLILRYKRNKKLDRKEKEYPDHTDTWLSKSRKRK